MKPPKPEKPQAPPPPVKAPEIQLGSEDPLQDPRLAKRRGRNALRTGLTIDAPSSNGSGLTIE